MQGRLYSRSSVVNTAPKRRLFDILSDEQKAIATDESPSILVAAGPGTGKTLSAAARIVHMIEKRKVNPEEILVLTQGEKTARDIQHLVDRHTRISAQGATIASASSFSNTLLEDYGVSRSSIPWVKEEHLVAFAEESRHLFHLRKYDPASRHDLSWKDLIEHFGKLQSFGVTPESYKQLVNGLEAQAQQAQANTSVLGGRTEKEKQLLLQYRLDFLANHKELSEAYRAFCQLKIDSGKYGLADRFPLAAKLISQPNVRSQLLSKFKHIIVDQIEDWGRLDWQFLESLAFFPPSVKDRSFLFFGDDDLAIMEWAGAPKDAFYKLKAALPNARFMPLTTNYRCSTEVLAAARSLISTNHSRLEQLSGVLKTMVSHEEYSLDAPKVIPAVKGKGKSKSKVAPPSDETVTIDGVHHLEFKTDSDENHGIAEIISKIRGDGPERSGTLPFAPVSTPDEKSLRELLRSSNVSEGNENLPSVGIITRFKGDALNLGKSLQGVGVPVPSPIIEYPEVKFLVNIIRTVMEPSDSHGLYELLCSGMFSIPGPSLAKITELHQQSSVSLREILTAYLDSVLASHDEVQAMSKEDVRLLKRAKKLLALLSLLESKLGSDTMQQMVYRILQDTRVLTTHRSPGSLTEEKQSDNIAKFLSLIEDTEAKLQNTRPTFVWQTLKRVCTQTPAGSDLEDFSDAVPVRTVWAAKGYEYDYVIIPHISDDYFPGRVKRNELQELLFSAAGMVATDHNHLVQMRRVLYTAMTRARKGLIFTYHTKSAHSRTALKISRYIPEAFGVPSAKYLPASKGLALTTHVSQSHLNDEEIDASHAHALRKLFGDLAPKNPAPEESLPPRAHKPAAKSAAQKDKESSVFGGGVFALESKKRLPALSIHALQVYLRCPLQFYQQFVIGANIPTTPLTIFQEAIGAVIHSISTQQVDQYKLSSFDKLRRTFDKTWESYGMDPVRNPEMYEQGMALSETLLDSEESHHDLASANTKWRLSATDSAITSQTVPINMFASSESEPNTVDFEDNFQRVYSNHHLRYFLQYSESFPPETPVLQNLARILAWAFYKHTKKTPSKVVLEYVTARFQMKLLQFSPTPQHMVEAEAYLNSLTKQLHTGKFEAVASANNCKRCPLGNTCPSSAARSRSSL